MFDLLLQVYPLFSNPTEHITLICDRTPFEPHRLRTMMEYYFNDTHNGIEFSHGTITVLKSIKEMSGKADASYCIDFDKGQWRLSKLKTSSLITQ